MERLLDTKVNLPRTVFIKLNLMWGVYFIAIGLINLYVMFYFSLDVWVDFKLFGMLGMSLLFLVIQAWYLFHHLKKHHKS